MTLTILNLIASCRIGSAEFGFKILEPFRIWLLGIGGTLELQIDNKSQILFVITIRYGIWLTLLQYCGFFIALCVILSDASAVEAIMAIKIVKLNL
jgi:hypothetical protein